MFQMFGFGGERCPRCEHKNAGEAHYCAQCGVTLGGLRNAPVLRENRWIAGPDELAVFFGVRELEGVFVKTLRVPSTARAYILQGDQATEVPQGEYEIEGFFARLNHLLRDQHAEILVTRTGALPVTFEFQDLATSEHLKVAAQLTVSVRIENVAAFARHFMTMPGAVTTGELCELLAPPVRQFAAEFVGAQSIRDMAANRSLRAQLDERLQGALKLLLGQYGLAAVQVQTLCLRHDKFDANRERIGTLFLAADERHVQLEHAKHLDQLYDAEEWQRIRREEQESRQRHKRAELRQDETIARAELTLAGAERAQAVRAREIELYGRIAQAKSRRDAIELGAGDMLAELEHELASKGAQRAEQAAGWEHLRALARIRMRTELDVAQQDALQARQLAQQRFSQQLMQQQIRNKIEQAMQIEDATRQHAELVRLREQEQAVACRAREIEVEEHQARLRLLQLANEARRREAARVLEWEEELAAGRKRELQRAEMLQAEETQQKIESMRRDGASLGAIAQQEKLLRTIEADALQQRQTQQLQLEAEERRHAQLLARAEALAAMDDTAKLALAGAANVGALADFMKTRVHATMGADQLAALAQVVGAAGVQGRLCAQGHPVRGDDKFCAVCGAALPA
ncbi:hypothetical protein [Massilia horti]|uniref:Band 7 domain-containing protein n=1 Tax=Massilia horti TaxID=2562153 RepID=A0A4Y9T2N8_9BURK|nr:hypothetical protein [Massilia horti]TFW31871.1 hypothetical protein E4O92_12150 [Massilia horti]